MLLDGSDLTSVSKEFSQNTKEDFSQRQAPEPHFLSFKGASQEPLPWLTTTGPLFRYAQQDLSHD